MQLLKTLDPRDNLEKTKRFQLVQFAQEKGATWPDGTPITEDVPAPIIRRRLRQLGLTRIDTTQVNHEPKVAPQKVEAVMADDDLWRQWREQNEKINQAERKPDSFIELRRACKERGIKFLRTDKADDLRAKLDGDRAA